jgi:hypothetical protein
VVEGKDGGKGKIVHMVWRGKIRKKISKFSKGVENPKSKNFVCPGLYFERLVNQWLVNFVCRCEACELRVKF